MRALTAIIPFILLLAACGAQTDIVPVQPGTPKIPSMESPAPGSDSSPAPMLTPVVSPSTVFPIQSPLPTANTTEVSGEYAGGGRTGEIEENWTSPAGTSSPFKMRAFTDNGRGRPHGLLIYLHGDGAGDYKWFWSALSKIAIANNLMPVSVHAPKGNSWYVDAKVHTEFLDSLVRSRLFREYNIDKDRVVFTGASGGPQFLTGQFLPLYGNHYSGAAIPMCGGGGPMAYGRWVDAFQPSPDFIRKFRMYYIAGTADFLYDQVVDSAAHYKSLGLWVQTEHPQGVKHCGFDMDEALARTVPVVLSGR